jgi:chemotaxis protein MotD
LSTIDSGVLGIVQGHASAKGKAGQGKGEGMSEKGDFATTIANLQGREGGEGRKGGRISISATAHGEKAEQPAGTARGKSPLADMAALAEAFRKAGEEPGSEGAAAQAAAAEHVGHKENAEKHKSTKKAGEAADDDAEDSGEKPAARTEAGNLLDMLAAPVVLPHAAGSAGGKSAAHGVSDVKAETGGKTSGKVAAETDTGTETGSADDTAEGADLPKTGTDRLFRLVRADGKGRSLDMSISGNGERTSVRDANPTAPKGEAVTVVDARRYIGLAQTGNAAAVTAAITQDPQWAASLSATGGLANTDAAATGKVVNTLKIQMHPIELGLVTATLHLQGEQLVVSLQVETGDAYRQLSDDQDTIVRALRGHGFTVDQVSVQLAPMDRGAQTNAQGQPQQQFSGQPQAQEGGSGRQGGEGASAREGRSYEGNTSENASAGTGGQPVRSGGVYL